MIRISAVGDIIMGDHPLYLGVGTGSRRVRDIFDGVRDVLRDSDLCFGNLEGPLMDATTRWSWEERVFRGSREDARLLKEAGFHVVGVANNHIMHHGWAGWESTLAFLNEEGIGVVGIKEQPMLILNRSGETIAVLAFSLRPEQKMKSVQDLPYATSSPPEIVKAVHKARNQANIVIVSLHWGEEYLDYPTSEQRKLARELCSAGATVIVGHHPHVLQGIEHIGDSLVAYSLGNFVSDMCQQKARRSGILHIEAGCGKARNWEFTPTVIDEGARPVIAEGSEKEAISRRFAILSERLRMEGPPPEVTVRRDIEKSLAEFRTEYTRYFLANCVRYPAGALQHILLHAVARRTRRFGMWVNRYGHN